MHKAIQNEIDLLQEKIKTLVKWELEISALEVVLNTIDKDLSPYITVGIQTGQVNGLILTFDPKTIEQVTPVLKQFSLLGYHIDGKPEDYEEIGRRGWKLKKEGYDAPVTLHAFFRGEVVEGQVCKFVKTGTKEVDVFELKCDPVVTQ